MVSVSKRLNQMVVNRLNKPHDGDIVVPQRMTSIIGTSSWKVDDANAIKIPQEHVDKMIEYGEKMIPALRQNRVQKSNPQVNNNPDHRIR
jgi:glycerol-3-phosphate dehydrogenase